MHTCVCVCGYMYVNVGALRSVCVCQDRQKIHYTEAGCVAEVPDT